MGSFNFFKPSDNHRDSGEPLSIRHMINQVVDDHAVDPSRVFITGLSSGGAMTSVMLATYPEAEGLGAKGKYMLEVGISSTRRIADFWGLTQ